MKTTKITYLVKQNPTEKELQIFDSILFINPRLSKVLESYTVNLKGKEFTVHSKNNYPILLVVFRKERLIYTPCEPNKSKRYFYL